MKVNKSSFRDQLGPVDTITFFVHLPIVHYIHPVDWSVSIISNFPSLNVFLHFLLGFSSSPERNNNYNDNNNNNNSNNDHLDGLALANDHLDGPASCK